MSQRFGCWLDLPSAAVAEVLGQAGFDWLLIDMEHGPFNIETVMHCLMALKGTGTRGIVRVLDGSEGNIKRALDLGADGIMVPNVKSAAEASDIAKYFHYAPQGARGDARTVVRASRWGRDGAAYKADFAAKHELIVQIETPEALAEIDAIAKVPGLSMLFFGPADYAASTGIAPDSSGVREAASTIAETAARHDLRAGSVLFPGTDVADLTDRGFSDISVAGDVGLLTSAAEEALAAARGKADA